MTNIPKPIAVVHFDQQGEISYHNTDQVLLLIIDERTPSDRVYAYGANATMEEIAALIGSSSIGHAGDGYLTENEVQAIRAAHWRYKGGEFAIVQSDGT